jgi:hypothetical protein
MLPSSGQRIPISFPLSSQISALAEIIAVVLGALHVVETGGREEGLLGEEL